MQARACASAARAPIRAPYGVVQIGAAREERFEAGAEGQLVGHVDAFVAEGVAGDLPAVVDGADHRVGREQHVVEVDLVEEGLPGDLLQRADIDAVRVLHVDDEVA